MGCHGEHDYPKWQSLDVLGHAGRDDLRHGHRYLRKGDEPRPALSWRDSRSNRNQGEREESSWKNGRSKCASLLQYSRVLKKRGAFGSQWNRLRQLQRWNRSWTWPGEFRFLPYQDDAN